MDSRPAKEPCTSWLKRNFPSIVSVFSVVTNVVILSAIIPSLRADLYSMGGQTQSMQSQLNGYLGQMLDLKSNINDASSNIAAFNAQYNVTKTTLELQLRDVTNSGAALLVEINGSLQLARNQSMTFEILSNSSLQQLQATLSQVANAFPLTINASNLRPGPQVLIAKNSDQSVVGDTVITWDREIYDTNNMFSITDNAYLTCQRAGIYVISLNYVLQSSTAGNFLNYITVKGSAIASMLTIGQASTTTYVTMTTQYRLAEGDSVALIVGGPSGTVFYGTSVNSFAMSMVSL